MNEMSAMPSAIVSWLSGREELEGIRFLTEFPPLKKAVPLKRITVAVGISSIEIEDNFADDVSALEQDEYCRKALIKLRFYIHAPYEMGGSACHSTFADITDCLTFASGLEIIKSGCEYIREDRDTGALVLPAYAIVNACLCPAQSSDIEFPSFLDKTLLCGSHIRDESIHLSAARQAFLDEPFVCGTYFGTGEGTRSFSPGFRPAAVILAASGCPPFAAENGQTKIYSALAAGQGGTLGLSITSSGFRVENGASYGSGGAFPALNESGVIYTYAALKQA
ncbi:MAG: hypothetical protein IKY00_04640 [Clostridia bacterium]|nr:hypothetical protein [Clostridia bacterium]